MAHPKGTRYKVPYAASDLMRIEDELHKMASILREIRGEMGDAGMEEVLLKLGTLRAFVDDYGPKMQGVIGEFRSEKAKWSAKQARKSLKKEK